MTEADRDNSPDVPPFPLTSQQKADELLRRWWHPSRKAPARRRGREMSSELLPEEVLKDLLGEEGFEIADTKAAHAILQRLTDAGFVVVAKSSLVTHRRGWGNCRRQSRKAPGLGRGLFITYRARLARYSLIASERVVSAFTAHRSICATISAGMREDTIGSRPVAGRPRRLFWSTFIDFLMNFGLP